MKTSKTLASAVAAAAVVGSIGLAVAQTSSDPMSSPSPTTTTPSQSTTTTPPSDGTVNTAPSTMDRSANSPSSSDMNTPSGSSTPYGSTTPSYGSSSSDLPPQADRG
ncbi:hypothetical protein ABXN37_21445 [Piscinibacter sakaiensis]|uniref:Uncharacterized protein n=1 Tax=Piscinibacter sakaiensis TaxID=1547922 RepID=A0A0K8P662_PISS1|nr:hypothetical protein [Piscinibacter sakaiensis]GAP37690.1 hypothetical protein ISF6_3635 [Piscinibacter sakaiensis]